jgi:hypothetical protein
MKQLSNAANLAQMIEFYKVGKITLPTLEHEFSKATRELTYPVKSFAKIVVSDRGNLSTTFGVTILPEMEISGASVTFLIDDRTIKSVLKPEEIVMMIAAESSNVQDALKEISRFTISKSDADVTTSDALLVFMRVYLNSVQNFESMSNDLGKKISDSKLLPKSEAIKEHMLQLEEGAEKIEIVIEKLIVLDSLPSLLIEKAKELVAKIKNDNKEKLTMSVVQSDEAPLMNQFRQQARALSDGTYDAVKGSRIIDYKYKPDTNQ